MDMPVTLSSRNFELTDADRDLIGRHLDDLAKLYDHIIRFEVVLETPHRHHATGHPYHFRIRIFVPGDDVNVTFQSDKEFPIALREAFGAARRKLQDYVRLTRGKVKRHESPQAGGTVTKLVLDEGYGFVQSESGDEVYFHANSVVNDEFNRLKIGDRVRFVEVPGEKGPQASTLRRVS